MLKAPEERLVMSSSRFVGQLSFSSPTLSVPKDTVPTLRDDPAANVSFWDTSADHNYSESREESIRLEGRDFHLESPVSEMYKEGTGLLSLSKLLRTVTVKLIASLPALSPLLYPQEVLREHSSACKSTGKHGVTH